MRRDLFKHDAYAEINVTPLMDLAWNLLIAFVIATTAAVQGIRVNLPKASAVASSVKPSVKAITINAEGQVYLDTFPVTMQELETRLGQYKAANPDLPVVVKGDEKISYKAIIDVLDVLQKLQISQLGLVTQKLVK